MGVSYLVLARKYRPQTFEDLVGQEHVQKTLASAIETGRIAHAFLFTGVRGVGKTTSARLLAKCLNCLGPDAKATGPRATPCQECAACREIAQGNDMDVQEIDGASYNGVDEVRKLQEGLAFRPARDRYKIFIVDEVHMLSTAAWNAFLKTLEEPPPHVKFIFATTEAHKVPVTILSRCQRYDFKLITTQVIAARLREVLAREGLTADDGSVSILAREAAGSMRDAMSLLDQVIAYSGATLVESDVARVLGVADRRVLHDLGKFLLNGDATGALKTVDAMATQGFDLVHTSKDLLAHLRNLVVAKVSSNQARGLLDLADDEVADVCALAGEHDTDDLLRVYQGFSRSFDEIARSGQVRSALEMALVRLSRRPPLLPLDELLARLGDLERRLGGAPPPAPRGGGGGGRGLTSISPAHVESVAHFSSNETYRPSIAPALGGAVGVRAQASAQAVALVAPALARPEAHAAPQPERRAATVTPITAARSAAPAAPAEAPRFNEGVDLARWIAVVSRVRAFSAPLASMLEHATPITVSTTEVRVAYAEGNFLGSQVTDPSQRALLERKVRAEIGEACSVIIDVGVRALSGATVAALDAHRRREAAAAARATVEEHPLVRATIALFDAELRDVKLPNEE